VEEQLKDCQTQAADEEVAQRNAAVIDVLEDRDQALSDYLKSLNVDQETLSSITDFVTSDRDQRTKSMNNQISIGVPYAELAKYDQEYFSQLQRAAQEALANHEAATERQIRVTRTLAGIPLAEDVEHISNQLAEKKAAQKALLIEIANKKEQLEKIQQQIKEADQNISSLMSDKALTDFADETAQRIFAQRETAQEILNQFNERLRVRHIYQLETLLLENLRLLYRKERLITAVTIHPKTLELTLKDQEKIALTPERLSAGERQLLAVGLVWSIARASTAALPTVIDTPLGRLDSHHRRTLVDNYFPMASHQSLLLSTDEEITGNLYAALAPRVSRAVTLTYNEIQTTSNIEPGYFGAQARNV
jgi:DNA sulfur modification protein DndD